MADGLDTHKVVFTSAKISKDGRKLYEPIRDGIPASQQKEVSYLEIIREDRLKCDGKPAVGVEGVDFSTDPITLERHYLNKEN